MGLTIKVLSNGKLASLKTLSSNSKIKKLINALFSINLQNGKKAGQGNWVEVVKCLKEINFTISDLDLVIIIVCLFVAIANSRCPELISALKYIFNNWCTNKKGESVNFIKAIADGDGVSLYNIFSYGQVFDSRILYYIGIADGGKFSKKFLGRVKRIRKWVLPGSKKIINEVIVPILNDMTGQTGKKNGLESDSPELFKFTVNDPSDFDKLEELRYVLRSVTIANTITAIPNKAFGNFTNLSHVDISSSVKAIGDYAFYNCPSLENVTIPGSVKTIGHGAFSHCASLENVTIPGSVKTIGNYVFYSCASLENVTIPGSVKTIGDHAFYNCPSLENVTIPGSVKTIGSSAFYNCPSLENVTIKDGVKDIDADAFAYCNNLKTITIPGSVKTIGDCAFYSCASLENVTIPGSVNTIGEGAFRGCINLREVTIEDGVRSIQSDAFLDCKSLERLRLPASLGSLPSGPFKGCPVHDVIKRDYTDLNKMIANGEACHIGNFAQNQQSGISSENQ